MQGLATHIRRIQGNARRISESHQTRVRIEVILHPTENSAKIAARVFKPNITGQSGAQKASRFAEMISEGLKHKMTHFSHGDRSGEKTTLTTHQIVTLTPKQKEALTTRAITRRSGISPEFAIYVERF